MFFVAIRLPRRSLGEGGLNASWRARNVSIPLENSAVAR
jgi:hypothetical protein